MGIGQTLRAELADPKRKAAVGALAGGAVLLGLRARKRTAAGTAAGAGEASSAQGAPARLVPHGATSSAIPDSTAGLPRVSFCANCNARAANRITCTVSIPESSSKNHPQLVYISMAWRCISSNCSART